MSTFYDVCGSDVQNIIETFVTPTLRSVGILDAIELCHDECYGQVISGQVSYTLVMLEWGLMSNSISEAEAYGADPMRLLSQKTKRIYLRVIDWIAY